MLSWKFRQLFRFDFVLLLHLRNDFAAKVFKVMHDKQRGALSLVRILNGTLKKGDKITTSNGNSEIVQRIYEPLADEYREITQVDQGNVGICAGLKVCLSLNLLFQTNVKIMHFSLEN